MLLAVIICFSSCGSFVGTVDTSNKGGQDTDTDISNPSTGEGGKFSVNVVCQGKPVVIGDSDINIEWTSTDGYSKVVAPLNSMGYAEYDGLDGNYKVALSSVPEGYIYNPNVHVATNDKKHIEIELYKKTEITTSKTGTSFVDGISIGEGYYSVTLNSDDQMVHFYYKSRYAGKFCVESWVDADDNLINPRVEIYNGSSVSGVTTHFTTKNDGGESSYYTKNFKYEQELTGPNQDFLFAIRATSKNNTYPITVNFVFQNSGELSADNSEVGLIGPMDFLVQAPGYDWSKYKPVVADTIQNGTRVLDNSMWKLWSKDEGGDDYYHLYDLEKYPETNGYGPLLFAYINRSSKFLDPITTIEYAGNNALTIYYEDKETGAIKKVNHKLAFEGLPCLVVDQTVIDPRNGMAPYMCTNDCPCYKNEEKSRPCYTIKEESLIIPYVGACPSSCTACTSNCRHLSNDAWELIVDVYRPNTKTKYVTTCAYDCVDCAITRRGCYGNCGCACDNKIRMPEQLLGYTSFTNGDGGYPVTEELKKFLQALSIQQLLFFDGAGYAETKPDYPIFAAEDAQWLFACYYYKPIK